MVTFKLEKQKEMVVICSMKTPKMFNETLMFFHGKSMKSHHAFFPQKKTQMSFPSEKQLFTPGWPPEVFPAVRRGPWPAPRHAAADPSVGTLLVPAVPSARLWQLTWKMLGR